MYKGKLAEKCPEEIAREKLRPTFKIRTPKEDVDCIDLQRLSKAHPIIDNVPQGDKPDPVWEADERNRKFKWWLSRETRALDGQKLTQSRTELRHMGEVNANPLTIADTFLPMATVDDMKLREDRAKSAMTGGEGKPVPPIKKKSVKRLGYIVSLALGVVIIGWVISKTRM